MPPECGSTKLIQNGRIQIGIVACAVAGLLQQEAVLLHHRPAQSDGQPLVVGDVLDESGDNATSLLEQAFIAPIGVHLFQFPRQSIVFSVQTKKGDREFENEPHHITTHPLPQEQQLNGQYSNLLIVPCIAREDTSLLCTANVPGVGRYVAGERVVHGIVGQPLATIDGGHPQQSVLVESHQLRSVHLIAVDSGRVHEVGDHIGLLPVANLATILRAHSVAHKIVAPLLVLAVEGITSWNDDGTTGWMHHRVLHMGSIATQQTLASHSYSMRWDGMEGKEKKKKKRKIPL